MKIKKDILAYKMIENTFHDRQNLLNKDHKTLNQQKY